MLGERFTTIESCYTNQSVVIFSFSYLLHRSVIKSSPKLELNAQQSAVVYTRVQCDWPSDSEEEDGGTKQSKWDSEGVSSYYNEYYDLKSHSQMSDECWDVEMESEQVTPECWDCSESYVSEEDDAGCKDLSLSSSNNGSKILDGCARVKNRTGNHNPNWMLWRGKSIKDDGDGVRDGDEEEIFDEDDYTW